MENGETRNFQNETIDQKDSLLNQYSIDQNKIEVRCNTASDVKQFRQQDFLKNKQNLKNA